MACLLSVVWPEARGESKLGQEAVAHVVMNRAKKSGRGVCEVVREPGQFVRGQPPSSFRVNINSRDPTNGATHFQVRDLPRWLGLRKYIKIGNHTFYGR